MLTDDEAIREVFDKDTVEWIVPRRPRRLGKPRRMTCALTPGGTFRRQTRSLAVERLRWSSRREGRRGS